MATIGTHDGCFHCDEVFAVALLKQLPEYKGAKIVRSRDPVELEKCDVVVDVGGIYDPSSFRFDHHQKDFNLSWGTYFQVKGYDIKFSSAGLVYVHFGKKLLSSIMNKSEDDVVLQMLFTKLYDAFVMEIDAVDNGISPADSMKYKVRTGIDSRVSRLNPWWNDPYTSVKDRFQQAIDMVTQEFLELIRYYIECWLPARSIVERAMAERHSVDPSDTIIVLKTSCPWKSHLFDLEREERSTAFTFPLAPTSQPRLRPAPRVLFVVFPVSEEKWIVQAVPEENFVSRVPLPAAWRALRDEELCETTKIPGCMYVHATGHLGTNSTCDGAIEMARVAYRLHLDELLGENKFAHTPVFSRGRRSYHHNGRR